MDNNDSNIKSQQTGGLKLMTVFIAVLALHVVVIGGFTVYHLMSGGSTDSDLTNGDKSHKGMNSGSIADTTTTDSGSSDKTASTASSTVPTEVANIPSAPSISTPAPAPAPDVSSPTVATIPTPALTSTPPPAPAPAPAAKPAATSNLATPVLAPTLAPPAEVADRGAQAPTGPIPADLAPPAEPSTVTSPAPAPANAPAASLAAGPVHMPPAGSSSEASHKEHAHGQIYVVKITDSYKKIAHKHHITVAQLKEANHIHDDVLHTGQKLVIPSAGGLVADSPSTLDAAPTVLSESVSPMTTGLTSSSSAAATGLHHHLYTVAKGDTLTRIAHRFHTTSSAIMAENGITKATKLTVGKKLKIPSEESRSARNGVTAPAQPKQVQAKENSNRSNGELATFVP